MRSESPLLLPIGNPCRKRSKIGATLCASAMPIVWATALWREQNASRAETDRRGAVFRDEEKDRKISRLGCSETVAPLLARGLRNSLTAPAHPGAGEAFMKRREFLKSVSAVAASACPHRSCGLRPRAQGRQETLLIAPRAGPTTSISTASVPTCQDTRWRGIVTTASSATR